MHIDLPKTVAVQTAGYRCNALSHHGCPYPCPCAHAFSTPVFENASNFFFFFWGFVSCWTRGWEGVSLFQETDPRKNAEMHRQAYVIPGFVCDSLITPSYLLLVVTCKLLVKPLRRSSRNMPKQERVSLGWMVGTRLPDRAPGRCSSSLNLSESQARGRRGVHVLFSFRLNADRVSTRRRLIRR